MAINLPGELSWVLNMLGYDWPEIDEDELRIGAGFVRDFEADLESLLQKVDAQIGDDLGKALETGTGKSLVDAWTETREDNMNKLLELLEPGALGMEIIADAVEALKLKVIAELVITAAQLAAAVATSAVTFGLGAAANVALIAARKKALTFIVNVAIEQLIVQVMTIFEDEIAAGAAMLIERILAAPATEAIAGDPTSYKADLAALEQVTSDMDTAADDFESISEDFSSKMSSLEIFTGM